MNNNTELNIKQTNNNDNNIESDAETNPDNECIICYDSESKIKLCTKCIYKYCNTCARKINFKCSICKRNFVSTYIFDPDIFYWEQNFQNSNNDFIYTNVPYEFTWRSSLIFVFSMFILYLVLFTSFSYYCFINYSIIYKFYLDHQIN